MNHSALFRTLEHESESLLYSALRLPNMPGGKKRIKMAEHIVSRTSTLGGFAFERGIFPDSAFKARTIAAGFLVRHGHDEYIGYYLEGMLDRLRDMGPKSYRLISRLAKMARRSDTPASSEVLAENSRWLSSRGKWVAAMNSADASVKTALRCFSTNSFHSVLALVNAYHHMFVLCIERRYWDRAYKSLERCVFVQTGVLCESVKAVPSEDREWLAADMLSTIIEFRWTDGRWGRINSIARRIVGKLEKKDDTVAECVECMFQSILVENGRGDRRRLNELISELSRSNPRKDRESISSSYGTLVIELTGTSMDCSSVSIALVEFVRSSRLEGPYAYIVAWFLSRFRDRLRRDGRGGLVNSLECLLSCEGINPSRTLRLLNKTNRDGRGMDVPFYAAVLLAFIPTLVLMYWITRPYTYPATEYAYFNDASFFILFTVGIVAGTVMFMAFTYIFKVIVYILLYSVIQVLVITASLNLKRYRGKSDSLFYGLAFGLGAGCATGTGIIYYVTTLTDIVGGSLGAGDYVLLSIVALAMILQFSAVGITVGEGIARHLPMQYAVQAMIYNIIFWVLFWIWLNNSGNEAYFYLFAVVLLLVSVMYMMYAKRKEVEPLMAEVRRQQKKGKAKPVVDMPEDAVTAKPARKLRRRRRVGRGSVRISSHGRSSRPASSSDTVRHVSAPPSRHPLW